MPVWSLSNLHDDRPERLPAGALSCIPKITHKKFQQILGRDLPIQVCPLDRPWHCLCRFKSRQNAALAGVDYGRNLNNQGRREKGEEKKGVCCLLSLNTVHTKHARPLETSIRGGWLRLLVASAWLPGILRRRCFAFWRLYARRLLGQTGATASQDTRLQPQFADKDPRHPQTALQTRQFSQDARQTHRTGLQTTNAGNLARDTSFNPAPVWAVVQWEAIA